MATITKTSLVDDIDGSADDVVTCAFGLGDSQFEIDLNTAHREELESVLRKFVESARQIKGSKLTRQKQATTPARTNREHTIALRAWAREQGLNVSERGRISKDVQEAYEAAH